MNNKILVIIINLIQTGLKTITLRQLIILGITYLALSFILAIHLSELPQVKSWDIDVLRGKWSMRKVDNPEKST